MNEPPMPPEPDSNNSAESESIRSKNFFFTPTTKKLGLIALVFGLLQIPLMMILGVIEERQTYNVKYPEEYKGPGAGQQTLIGPVLTVPYHYQITEEKQVAATAESSSAKAIPMAPPVPPLLMTPGATPAETPTLAPPQATPIATPTPAPPQAAPPPVPAPGTKTVKVTRTETGHVHFFPENLSVKGLMEPELRDEGKFKSILYSTTLKFKGTFDTADLKQKKLNPAANLIWSDAFVALGISDLRGIRSQSTLEWNGTKCKFIPGVNGLTLFPSGQFAPIGMTAPGHYPFSFTVDLNGSRDLNIFPAGKQNTIALSSPWNEPTFTGGFLPTEKKVTKAGFDSLWETSYFSRNLPQIWTDFDPEIKNSLAQYTVGVNLSTPVEFYRTAIRAVKYGSLFIVMTFVTFYFFEKFFRIRIHEMQYLLVGLALSLFFLLLIAISEQVPFMWAYIIASVSTIIQITWYTKTFSRGLSKNFWKVMTVTLSMLYSYLYILLQLENLSLLFGSIGLFVMLTGILYTTRNINWYGDNPKPEFTEWS